MALINLSPLILDLNRIKKPKKDTIMCVDNKYIKADIYYQVEPESIIPITSYLINNYSKYKLILTFNDEVLQKCPNAKLVLYGTTWISSDDYTNLPVKEYLLTTLVGHKLMTPAHYFRHELYNLQEKINIPKIFYRSKYGLNILKDFGNNPILKDDKKFNMLKNSQFHLTIENCSIKYYFSEKLCDALITKNIPIYYGCTNINDYFDTTGWIILETMNVSEFFEKIKCIDETYYNKYIDIVNKNFEKVKEYIDPSYMINNVLSSFEDY
jgi:hypothetical protein